MPTYTILRALRADSAPDSFRVTFIPVCDPRDNSPVEVKAQTSEKALKEALVLFPGLRHSLAIERSSAYHF